MSFGGSPSYPDVEATPEKQQTKNITEAATAARTAQSDKAKKAKGLRSTILTSALSSGTSAGGKTLLGQ